jgi:hypothetical protein
MCVERALWRLDCIACSRAEAEMRSLFLRWVVAVVVGSLWGAIAAPGNLHAERARMKTPAADATRQSISAKTIAALGPSAVNTMNF